MTDSTDPSHLSWNDPSLLVASDTRSRATRRRLQSHYREKVLQVPPGRDKRGIFRASMLPTEALEEQPNLNFLTPEIGEYARERAALVVASGGTLEEDRLCRNMLSSMPLCFNIFGALRQNPSAAAPLLSDLLDLDIAHLDLIEVEWIPKGEHLLHDRTAFDAIIQYRTTDDRRGLLGVETKYTEPFSRKEYDRPSYRTWTTPEFGFREGAADRLKAPATNQLWRNLLLAIATAHNTANPFDQAHILVLAMADDRGAKQALKGLRKELLDPDDHLRSLSLEDLVAAASQTPELKAWADRFHERYLQLPTA